MKSRMMMMAVAALAACGGPPAGQDVPGPGGSGPVDVTVLGGGTPSVYGLLGERQRLGLTGAQVTSLDSIASAWSATHQALARELAETPTPGTTLQRIAQNNRAANTAVEGVLTEAQRRMVCETQAQQRGEPAPRVPATAPRGPGGGATRARAEAAAATPRGWPWCTRVAAPGAPGPTSLLNSGGGRG